RCFSELSPLLHCRTFFSRLTRSIQLFISRLQECSLSSPRRLASFRHAAPPRSIQWLHCDTSDVVAESISERSNHLLRGGRTLDCDRAGILFCADAACQSGHSFRSATRRVVVNGIGDPSLVRVPLGAQ